MLTQNCDRNELIAMLAWQFDMGIDEALLDHPQADAVQLRFDQLLGGSAPQYDKLHCAVLQVRNKSAARAAEATAINAMRAMGFPLRSDRDSGHVHFSSSAR